MAKVAVRGAGSHQMVMTKGAALATWVGSVENKPARCGVDANCLSLQDGQIAALNVTGQHIPNRCAHRWRTKTGSCHLLKQESKKMVVGAVGRP